MIEAGTVAEDELLASLTTRPVDGALLVSVIVPIDEAPPRTTEGMSEMEEIPGGLRVKVSEVVELPSFPTIVADLIVATGVVTTEKLALA